MVKSKHEEACPCGSGKGYAQCCGLYISGTLFAPNAQALMRSRYTAYTLEDETYLLKTWHLSKRPSHLPEQQQVKWIALTVIAHHQEEHTAVVEFSAQFKVNGRATKMREKSRFVFEDGQWFYVSGDLLN